MILYFHLYIFLLELKGWLTPQKIYKANNPLKKIRKCQPIQGVPFVSKLNLIPDQRVQVRRNQSSLPAPQTTHKIFKMQTGIKYLFGNALGHRKSRVSFPFKSISAKPSSGKPAKPQKAQKLPPVLCMEMSEKFSNQKNGKRQKAVAIDTTQTHTHTHTCVCNAKCYEK